MSEIYASYDEHNDVVTMSPEQARATLARIAELVGVNTAEARAELKDRRDDLHAASNTALVAARKEVARRVRALAESELTGGSVKQIEFAAKLRRQFRAQMARFFESADTMFKVVSREELLLDTEAAIAKCVAVVRRTDGNAPWWLQKQYALLTGTADWCFATLREIGAIK